MPPAGFFVAVMVVVEFALKTVQHVVHLREPGFPQRVAGVDGTVAATANQHDGAIHADGFF